MSGEPGSATRRIGRNALVRSGGELAAKLASLVFLVAVARELGTSSFGDFTFAFSLTTVLIIAAGFGTDNLVAREVSRDRAKTHHMMGNVIAIKACMSVPLILVAIVIAALAGQSAETVAAVAVLGAGVAIENLGRTWHAVLQAHERMEFISVSLILQRTLTAVAAVILLTRGGGLLFATGAYTAGAVVGVLVAHWTTRRYVTTARAPLDRSRWPALVKAAIPLGIATMLFTVLLRLDATLLGFLKGGENNVEVGVYGAAFRLVEATWFFSWSFGAASLPWIARHRSGSGVPLRDGYELGLKAVIGVLMPIGLAFALLAPDIIGDIYGEGYGGAVLPLRILGAMTVLYGINYYTATVLTARDEPARFTRMVAPVVVLNVALNLALIPSYGADGAAVAASVSGLLLAGLAIWQADAVVGAPRPLKVLAAPLAGGAAMTAGILVSGLSGIPAALLGIALYALAAFVVERALNRPDLDLLLSLVSSRSRPGSAREGSPPA